MTHSSMYKGHIPKRIESDEQVTIYFVRKIGTKARFVHLVTRRSTVCYWLVEQICYRHVCQTGSRAYVFRKHNAKFRCFS